MAKKSGKGKEKKLARKADNERASALAQQLRALNEGSAEGRQLAQQYPAFLRYDRKGLTAALRFLAAPELPLGLLDWALGLTRLHMQALYEACPDWGWSDAKKRAELADPAARYLVAYQQQPQAVLPAPRQQQPQQPAEAAEAAGVAATEQQQQQQELQQENSAAVGNSGGGGGAEQQGPGAGAAEGAAECGQPVAFLHYRFEEEAGEAVLYCYEIQVAEAVQGKGLGRFLMQLLELVGRRSGVARLMLTVFNGNVGAVQLYRKLGYVQDADSPGSLDPSGSHKYEILTKWLTKPGAAPAQAQA